MQISLKHLIATTALATACLVNLSGCVAKSESDVIAYVSVDEEFATPILAAFDRSTDYETGVVPKFDVESTKTVGLANEIIAAGDHPPCDLFWNNEPLHMIRLQKRGRLAKHDFDLPGNFPPDMRASDGTWCGFAARARVLIVNTDLLPDPEDWPNSVSDLTDPKWKDRCAMARPLFGTAATHFAVIAATRGVDASIEQLTQIAGNANVLSGNKQVALSVSGGQHAWGLTDTDDAIVEKDQGFAVAIVFPDQMPGQPGTLRIPNTVGVIRDAPHPIAAARLADYLVTPETEDRLSMGDSSQIPMISGSKFPSRVLPKDPVRWMRVDFEAAAEVWEEYAAAALQLFN